MLKHMLVKAQVSPHSLCTLRQGYRQALQIHTTSIKKTAESLLASCTISLCKGNLTLALKGDVIIPFIHLPRRETEIDMIFWQQETLE